MGKPALLGFTAALAIGCGASGLVNQSQGSTTGKKGASSATSSSTTSSSTSSSGTTGAATTGAATATASSSTSGTSSATSIGTGTSGAGASTGGSIGGSSGGSFDGGPVCNGVALDGCWSDEADGGPCVTVADCALGLVCTYGDLCYSGYCGPPPPPQGLACVPTGNACTDGGVSCCAGFCTGGTCPGWKACGETASPCADDTDCCNRFACNGSTCQPTCGEAFAPCQDFSDCCQDEGLGCEQYQENGNTGAVCVGAAFNQPYLSNGDPVVCGAACSTYQCQLGAACGEEAAEQSDYGGADPCHASGDVCYSPDGIDFVCESPKTDVNGVINWNTPTHTDTCIPGAQPCMAVNGSTLVTRCIDFPELDSGYCVEPCARNADCVNAFDYCETYGDAGGYCKYWDVCSNYYEPCDSSGTNDGLCMAEDFGFGLTGFCLQATFDGGGTGAHSLALGEANRQNQSFCDTSHISNQYGLCEPICNGGTAAGDGGADAGPYGDGGPFCSARQACYSLFGPIAEPLEIGFCSPNCDFTAGDGGGCPVDADGIQERCLPQLLMGYPDAPTGFCAAAVANPLPVGSICPYAIDGQTLVAIDDCAPGSLCVGETELSIDRTCLQLCNTVGSSVGCPTGKVCKALVLSDQGPAPTQTGICE